MSNLDDFTTYIEKQRREGLVPKKVRVKREGKTFEQTRWVRPEEAKLEAIEARFKQEKDLNEEIRSRFPQFVSRDFKGVELAKDISAYSGELRHDLEGSDGMYYNGKVYINVNKKQDRNLLKEEFLPKRTLTGNVIHEFGHYIYHNVLTQDQIKKWDNLFREKRKTTDEEWEMRKKGETPSIKGPTYYSLSSYGEFFSEVFMLANIDKGNRYFKEQPNVGKLLTECKLW